MINKTKNLQVVIKRPGKEAQVKQLQFSGLSKEALENQELALLQKLVGGYIEISRISEDVNIVCNEEGLSKKLPHNVGSFVGTILFVREQPIENPETEEEQFASEFVSLTEDQVRKAILWCEKHKNDQPPDYAIPNYDMKVITNQAEADYIMGKLREQALERFTEWNNL